MQKTKKFSIKTRSKVLERAKEETFDLIIIGGGVTGAGILLDAASRGLKTLLLEKGDFASGTSSKSTKLIHGGLRYLKQMDFGLVHEVGTERAIVHDLAPHLVVPEKMLLPLTENGAYSKWLTSIGLMVYDLLAKVTGDDKRKMLNTKEALKKEPLLPVKGLTGAGYYAEYRTDDARLTMEIIKTARNYGGMAANYTEVVGFVYGTDNKVSGVTVKDFVSGQNITIQTNYVVSAAGPWVDDLRQTDKSKKGKRLHLTKGVHLVVPHKKFPVQQSVYFDVPDGRMMFAIPRGKITYFGTTDTNYDGDKENVLANKEDVDYLLNGVNTMFPTVNLKPKHVISSWAGLRPLIHEDGKSASELSRKDEVFESKTGLISIAGGKLTGYRKMSERIVDLVAKKAKKTHKKELNNCITDAIPLCGNDFKKYKQVKKYTLKLTQKLKAENLTAYDAWYLVSNYGKQANQIWNIYNALEPGESKLRLGRAELQFTLQHEMVTNPMDFFVRRTGRLYFDIESIPYLWNGLKVDFKNALNASDEELDSYEKELNNLIKEHSKF